MIHHMEYILNNIIKMYVFLKLCSSVTQVSIMLDGKLILCFIKNNYLNLYR